MRGLNWGWPCGVAAWIAIAAAVPVAHAQKPSDEELPSCLDQSIRDQLGDRLRPRGVQKRDFLKNKKFYVYAHGGVFAADLLSSSYTYGGAVGFFFTEDLGFEARFNVMPVALDLDDPVADFFGDDRFESGTAFLGLANLLWAPIHAKLRIGGAIVHSDIMLTAGGGRLLHDSVQGVTFNAGLAIDMYVSGWFTLRFDLRDVVAVQEAVAETRLTNNLMATAGFAIWIPTWL